MKREEWRGGWSGRGRVVRREREEGRGEGKKGKETGEERRKGRGT